MTSFKQIRLLAVVTSAGFAWEIRDDTERLGHGDCANIAELRGVELRAGLGCVQITGALSDADRAKATGYGWHINA